jgi:hypothetical protein
MFGPFGEKDDLTRAQEMQQQEMTHAERMKAIELGQPLPEVEKARAEAQATLARSNAATAIVGVLVRAVTCLGTLGIALGATAVVLVKAPPESQLVALALVWTAATLVGGATALAGVVDWPRMSLRGFLPERESQSALLDDDKLFSAIQK